MIIDLSDSARAALDARYEVLRELGRGGTAVVYLARERETGIDVAIKLVRSKYLDDQETLARFAREARLVAQLSHPNIVPVRAVLELEGSGFGIVMAHLAGRTLREVLRSDGFLTPSHAERVIHDIGRALEAAHSAGIVHRDVKPENIFLVEDGGAVLADFGVARSVSDTALTMHGVTLGTPAYMSPEQIDGRMLDGRADIYSLGMVGWEMLSGRRPWGDDGLFSILYRQKHELLPDLREFREGVPDTLAGLIARSMEKNREARWPDVRAMLEALDSDQPVPVAGPRGAETMRFIRTPGSAPLALARQRPAMPESAALSPALEAPAPRQRARLFVGVAAAVILVGALIGALVHSRSTAASLAQAQVSLAGDVRKPVELQATGEASPLVRPDIAASAPATRTSAPPSPVASAATTPSVSVRPAPPPSNESASSKAPIFLDARPSIDAKRRELDSVLTAIRSSTVTVTAAARAVGPSTSSIAAGGMHSCFIAASGRAACWGSNEQHQLGGSPAEPSAPITVETSERFTSIAAGLSHSCAITREGLAACWGSNDHGQLGDGSRTARVRPAPVADGHLFRAVAAGSAHTCALDADGLAWCWGSNTRGQLGDSTTRDNPVPVNVRGGRFAAVVAGWEFACGLASGGQVSCWGDNRFGQLGDGSTTDRREPVALSSSITFTTIAAGSSHACGVTAAGEAYCWGQNRAGQLGDGTTVDHATPVRVHATAHFVSITTGGAHTCAVADDGAAFCWGRGTYGQLGSGRTTDESLPARVVDDHVFVSVRAFGSHTCGVTTVKEPFCWGYNSEHQLGDGTRTHRMRPVRVDVRGGG
jgi:alpha-tubulin suppressor-like RCC1 family protein/serine/threonine protein kinase